MVFSSSTDVSSSGGETDLAQENEDLKNELDRLKSELLRRRSSAVSEVAEAEPKRRDRRESDPTQELEDLTQENVQLAERLKALDDENSCLKHTLSKQKEEIVSLQELTEKTGISQEERSKVNKTKLHVWKDKVNNLQKQMKEDKVLTDMLEKERKHSQVLERQLQDATEKLKHAGEELGRLQHELEEMAQQKFQNEQAYNDLDHQMEELRVMAEGKIEAAERQVQELNDQLVMMSPSNAGLMETSFDFAAPRGSVHSAGLGGGQDLLSQLQMSDDIVGQDEEEVPFLDLGGHKVDASASGREDEPETSGNLRERLAELQSECQKLNDELAANKKELASCKDKAAADAASAARRETFLREEHDSMKAELQKVRAALEEMGNKDQDPRAALQKACPDEIQELRQRIQVLETDLEQARQPKQQETGEAMVPHKSTHIQEEREEKIGLSIGDMSTKGGLKLSGAKSKESSTCHDGASSSRVAELESQVAELECDLAQARRLLQRWQDEKDKQTWSGMFNGFMCAANR